MPRARREDVAATINGRSRAWFGLLGGALLLAGCRGEAPRAGARTELTKGCQYPLIMARGGQIVALGEDGAESWQGYLPGGDKIVTPIAVRPDATVFVRGARHLYAIRKGKVSWKRPVPAVPARARRRLYKPLPRYLGGVAVMTEPGLFRFFDDHGTHKWDVRVPGGGRVVSPPLFTRGGLLVIPTNAGLYAIEATGKLDWHLAVRKGR